MGEGLYERYIHSEEWRKRRFAKLEETRNRCQYCGEPDFLSVHHLNYDHLGYEDNKELIVLCVSCHWVADEIRRNPKSDLLKRLNAKRYKPRTTQTPTQFKKRLTNKERRQLRNRKHLEERQSRKRQREHNG